MTKKKNHQLGVVQSIYFLLCFLIFYPTTALFSELTQKKCILVVGGAGFIGSHVNEYLHRNGYDTVVLDNLSHGHQDAVRQGTFIQGDVGDGALLDKIFLSYPIDAVMHFAAFIDVGESVKDPLKYYINNVSNTMQLLDRMHQHGIKVFIFSSTAAIFGNPQEDCVNETHPCEPINPYGRSKLMVETILKDMSAAYDLNYCCLRYFNAAGGDPERILKNYKEKESNLIPLVLRSVIAPASVTIFGTDYPTQDGTAIRDYIHVMDLAAAHIQAMERLFEGNPSTCYNLGNGQGFSVKEVIETVQKVTGRSVKVIEGPRREGDPCKLVASSQKAMLELNWQPRYCSLETIIEDAWKALNY